MSRNYRLDKAVKPVCQTIEILVLEPLTTRGKSPGNNARPPT